MRDDEKSLDLYKYFFQVYLELFGLVFLTKYKK